MNDAQNHIAPDIFMDLLAMLGFHFTSLLYEHLWQSSIL